NYEKQTQGPQLADTGLGYEALVKKSLAMLSSASSHLVNYAVLIPDNILLNHIEVKYQGNIEMDLVVDSFLRRGDHISAKCLINRQYFGVDMTLLAKKKQVTWSCRFVSDNPFKIYRANYLLGFSNPELAVTLIKEKSSFNVEYDLQVSKVF